MTRAELPNQILMVVWLLFLFLSPFVAFGILIRAFGFAKIASVVVPVALFYGGFVAGLLVEIYPPQDGIFHLQRGYDDIPWGAEPDVVCRCAQTSRRMLTVNSPIIFHAFWNRDAVTAAPLPEKLLIDLHGDTGMLP